MSGRIENPMLKSQSAGIITDSRNHSEKWGNEPFQDNIVIP